MTSSALTTSCFAAVPMSSTSEIGMAKSHLNGIHSHRNARAFESGVGERVVAYLRTRHPAKTVEHVAAETGVPANTIKTWLDRGTAPRADHYCRLWLAYGPSFLAATAGCAPAWLDQANRDEAATRLKAEIATREEALKGLCR